MDNINVLVIGDIMLDHYINGYADRLSQEAPIPIVQRQTESFILGGAANVASNLSNLDIQVGILGAVGADNSAEIIMNLLDDQDIAYNLFSGEIDTTRKTRIVANGHQVVRVDQESKFLEEDDFIEILNDELALFNGQFIIISDYNKGICGEKTCASILAFAQEKNINVLIDPKINDWHKFDGAFLIKPNLAELSKSVGIKVENDHQDILRYSRQLLNQYNIQYLLVTRGAKGMSLIGQTEDVEISPSAVEVFDVTGAGDTVISVLTYGLSQNMNIVEAAHLANKASAYVVTKRNTYSISKVELDEIRGGM